MCGTTPSPLCAGTASVCQIDNGTAPQTGYVLAVWAPEVSPVVWQYLGHGAMSAILQDGAGCGTGIPTNRLTNLTFTCNPLATEPVLLNTVEDPACSYALSIETDLVCGAPFQQSPPGSGVSSSTGGSSVRGDPQFVGLRGQSFQVHGIDGAVYSLIADHGMLVNARFRYLSFGRCPASADTDTDTSNCWSHPGSYLGEVGVVSAGGARLHVASGSWDAGFDSVALDGAALPVGTNASVSGLTVHVLSAYALRVRAGNFELELHNSDRFVNIVETRVLHWSALASHGLLGQTWRAPRDGLKGRQLPHIEGDVDDYVEADNDLLGGNFVFGADGLDAADQH